MGLSKINPDYNKLANYLPLVDRKPQTMNFFIESLKNYSIKLYQNEFTIFDKIVDLLNEYDISTGLDDIIFFSGHYFFVVNMSLDSYNNFGKVNPFDDYFNEYNKLKPFLETHELDYISFKSKTGSIKVKSDLFISDLKKQIKEYLHNTKPHFRPYVFKTYKDYLEAYKDSFSEENKEKSKPNIEIIKIHPVPQDDWEKVKNRFLRAKSFRQNLIENLIFLFRYLRSETYLKNKDIKVSYLFLADFIELFGFNWDEIESLPENYIKERFQRAEL